MNIEQVVAEMPKAENPFDGTDLRYKAPEQIALNILEKMTWDDATEAQCQLLAEQEYRKIRTQYEIVDWLRLKFPVLEEVCSIELLAQELHRWWLEGE